VKDGAATYGKLAPLAAVDSDLPIFEQIRGYGRILNREKQADELIATFQDSIRGIAGRVTTKRVSIARAFGDTQVFMYTKIEPFTALWVDLLGLEIIPGADGVAKAGTIIAAAERIGDLQGDALVVIQGIERLQTNPLWGLLPAVKAGHVHHVGDYLTYAGNGGLNALRDQIIGIANFLAAIK
jgi:ABC-type Fe3+-hydroxamate transport system substrate-binding protein